MRNINYSEHKITNYSIAYSRDLYNRKCKSKKNPTKYFNKGNISIKIYEKPEHAKVLVDFKFYSRVYSSMWNRRVIIKIVTISVARRATAKNSVFKVKKSHPRESSNETRFYINYPIITRGLLLRTCKK